MSASSLPGFLLSEVASLDLGAVPSSDETAVVVELQALAMVPSGCPPLTTVAPAFCLRVDDGPDMPLYCTTGAVVAEVPEPENQLIGVLQPVTPQEIPKARTICSWRLGFMVAPPCALAGAARQATEEGWPRKA